VATAGCICDVSLQHEAPVKQNRAGETKISTFHSSSLRTTSLSAHC
jgi:hypothetical protein